MDVFELEINEIDFKETELYKAIESKKPLLVLETLQNGANVHMCDPEFHTTYLHLVVSLADLETEEKLTSIVYQLSNAGIDVDALQHKSETALEIAIRRQLPHMVMALLRVGADTQMKDYHRIIQCQKGQKQTVIQDVFDRYKPGLWVAVEAGDIGMVHILVNSWCRINIKKDGKALMEVAKEGEHAEELLSVLDDYQVTIEFVHATLAGDKTRMMQFLMDSKPCDPYIMDISHQEAGSVTLTPRTLRETAISLGHQHTLDYLPKDDFDKDTDVRGYLGGLTLFVVNTLLSQQLKETDIQNLENNKTSKEKTAQISSRKTKSSKLKPMKALIAYQNIKKSSTSDSEAPDVIMDHSSATECGLFSRQLDLLNDTAFVQDDRSYERSHLTGSVALRSKTKSRKSLISSYSVSDDSTSKSYEFGEQSVDQMTNKSNMASFHAASAPSMSRDYEKYGKLSYIRGSMGRSKSRSKEIISKMCVLS